MDKRWRSHIEGDSPYHVWPEDDLIAHDTDFTDGPCICGPHATAVVAEDGTVGWILTHHALDGEGREA